MNPGHDIFLRQLFTGKSAAGLIVFLLMSQRVIRTPFLFPGIDRGYA